jgi:hypothetical protein
MGRKGKRIQEGAQKRQKDISSCRFSLNTAFPQQSTATVGGPRSSWCVGPLRLKIRNASRATRQFHEERASREVVIVTTGVLVQ